jgi:hypothetical protein
MLVRLRQSWKNDAALLLIFLGGQVFGYVLGARNAHPESGPSPSEIAAQGWSEKALLALQKSLNLNEEQMKMARPILDSTGEKIVKERQRALFQIHLYALSVHDDLWAALEPDQQAKLRKSRKRTKQTIEKRFSSLLDANSGPAASSTP